MSRSREFISSDESSDEEKVKNSSKKRSTKGDHDTGSSADESKSKNPTKKLKVESKKSKESSEPIWDIGKNKQVNVRFFKQNLYVDIREMYVDKNDGTLKPGKKGICLNMENWANLVDIVEEVDKKVKDMRKSI